MLVNSLWTVNNTVTNRQVVKAWIEDSGFYENIIDEIVTIVDEETAGEGEESSIDSVVLVRSANKVFTPELLQQKAEIVLDGFYDWLDGTNPNLEFDVNLDEQKVALVTALTDEANEKLNSLPVCSVEQLAAINDTDVFALDCRPPAVQEFVDDFYRDLTSGDDFLSEISFSSGDVTTDVDGENVTIDQAFPDVPAGYSVARQTVWLVIVAAVIWTAIIVALSKGIRNGVKHALIAFILATVATLMIVFG